MLSGLHMWASAALTLSSCVTESCPTSRLMVQGDDRLRGLRWEAVEELVLQERGQTNSHRATSFLLVFGKQGRVTRLHILVRPPGTVDCGELQAMGSAGMFRSLSPISFGGSTQGFSRARHGIREKDQGCGAPILHGQNSTSSSSPDDAALHTFHLLRDWLP